MNEEGCCVNELTPHMSHQTFVCCAAMLLLKVVKPEPSDTSPEVIRPLSVRAINVVICGRSDGSTTPKNCGGGSGTRPLSIRGINDDAWGLANPPAGMLDHFLGGTCGVGLKPDIFIVIYNTQRVSHQNNGIS